MRNRNENVEGLNEPHQVEVILDGQRLQLFTVTPNRNRMGDYYADEGVDKHLQLRTRVSAGPHDVGATFLRKNGAFVETERQPYDAHFNMNRHPRLTPAVYTLSITGPFDAGAVGDPSKPDRPQSRVECRAVSASSSAGRRRAQTRPLAPGGSCRRPRAARTGVRSRTTISRCRSSSSTQARAEAGSTPASRSRSGRC